MAADNPDWGYGHIHGELRELGYKVLWQTVQRVMLEHGLLDDPSGPKRMSWKTFLQNHFDCIAAADFFTVAAWGLKGLTRYLVFFVIDIASRKVEIAGIYVDPRDSDAPVRTQSHRRRDGFLKGKRILIHDRDPLYTMAAAPADRGCIGIYGTAKTDHALLAEHIARSERWVEVTGPYGTVREWSPLPTRPDNHWLDCLVGCAAAASMCGIRTTGDFTPARQRKRYTQQDLRRR